MKKFVYIPLIIAFAFVLQLFLPWWIISPVCFIICYVFHPGKFNAFAGSLLSVFMLWSLKAWWADQYFDTPMSDLLGNLLGNISGGTVIFFTGIIGGLTGGCSGLLGDWMRQLAKK